MNLIQLLLYHVNPAALIILIVGGTVLLSISGLLVVRRIVPIHRLKAHNDVAGFMFATLGVIYAVMLAFMVIVAWQNFDNSGKTIEKEANYLADLYRDSIAFSPSFQTELHKALDAYITSIIKDEWPLLAKGERSLKTQKLSGNIYKLYATYSPRNDIERIFLAESVRKRNEAGELRRMRILDAGSGINPVLWTVLIVGGLITIVFTFFFGTENFLAQAIMTALLATMVSMILCTIMLFDYPFTGSVCIKPDAFVTVLDNLATLK
jgi:hypothetical protein